MLKKITINQVRLGMYIQSLEGDWLSHPFWKTRFILDSIPDLERLRTSGVPAVWIDTSRGKDVDTTQLAAEEDSPIAVDVAPEPAPIAPPAAPLLTPTVSGREEAGRAARILSRSKEAVTELFNEVRLGKAVDAAQYLPLVEEISNSVARNSSTLISLARLKTRDEYTYMHSVSVCALMVALAQQLGKDDEFIRMAGIAGLLHDVGKAMIPPQILNKPGKLTDAEFAVMRTHPAAGHRILLGGNSIPAEALDVCLHHHEKMDGSGYPEGFAGDGISLLARMGAICDVYDAITSCRPYKDAWQPADSISRMLGWDGHFDREILLSFVKTVGIYPVGTLVRLKSERLAVVVEQNLRDMTRPLVKVFFSARSKSPLLATELDLALQAAADQIASREDPEKWGFSRWDAMWKQLVGL